MKIYFADPLCSLAERRFNSALAEKAGKPWLKGVSSAKRVVESTKPPFDKMVPDERRKSPL